MLLNLVVTKSEIGKLETNLAMLESYVDEQLKNYVPELYDGDSDKAKKDRAVLNNSKKVITQKRIEIMKELTKPFLDFETRCKLLEKKIVEASDKLDYIVKSKEEEEKSRKRTRIAELWLSFAFDMFSVDRVFNPKWLNKTCKESEIKAEMESIISKTYTDLKMIERFASTSDLEVETLKALYLECLDIEEVFARGDELAKNRKRAMQEEITRADRERTEMLERQRQEILEEQESMSSCLADEEFGVDPQWTIHISASQEDMAKIKQFMDNLDVSYNIEEEEKTIF